MKPYFTDAHCTIYHGDCLTVLGQLPEKSVQCCVTSPPYFGLRSYLAKDDPRKALEIGSEATVEEYVAKMVAVFEGVRRVLKDDGTLWLNLGDKRNGIRSGGYKNSVNFDGKNKGAEKQRGHSRRHAGFNDRWDKMTVEEQCTGMRNKRDVWTIAPANYPEAHFATFPTDLIKPCILAGSRPNDVVIDPFGGSGTTGEVAIELGRRAQLIELNAEYLPLIEKRTFVTAGLPFTPQRDEVAA